ALRRGGSAALLLLRDERVRHRPSRPGEGQAALRGPDERLRIPPVLVERPHPRLAFQIVAEERRRGLLEGLVIDDHGRAPRHGAGIIRHAIQVRREGADCSPTWTASHWPDGT